MTTIKAQLAYLPSPFHKSDYFVLHALDINKGNNAEFFLLIEGDALNHTNRLDKCTRIYNQKQLDELIEKYKINKNAYALKRVRITKTIQLVDGWELPDWKQREENHKPYKLDKDEN